MILISNDRTSASKKANGMALIRTLMVSTTAFERTKENSMVLGRLDSAQSTSTTYVQKFTQIKGNSLSYWWIKNGVNRFKTCYTCKVPKNIDFFLNVVISMYEKWSCLNTEASIEQPTMSSRGEKLGYEFLSRFKADCLWKTCDES